MSARGFPSVGFAGLLVLWLPSATGQVDALSRSLLILSKKPKDIPKGSTPVGHIMSHVVNDTPMETHVYASLLHNAEFVVVTDKTDTWTVSKGKIKKNEIP